MAEPYELRERLLALFEREDVETPIGWKALADRIIDAVDDRIEDYRAGIDVAAEEGSDTATREGIILSELQEALRT